jgi:RHS repeat-associated protein
MTNCSGQWDTDDGHAPGYDCGGDNCSLSSGYTATSYWQSNSCSWYDSNGCHTDQGSCSNYLIESIAEEYKTEQLLSTDGLSYPSGDWTGAAEAYTKISDYERQAEVQKMRYRFKVIAPAGAHFEFYYYTHYLVDGTTNEIISTNKLEKIGTGAWTYYDGGEIAPPSATTNIGGCDYTVGARKWVDLGCGGAGSPCSSGTCSMTPGSVAASDADYGVSVTANLGRDSFGQGSGSLMLAASTPDPSLVTPAALQYVGNLSNPVIIRDSGGNLRQVLTAQVLANIVTNSSTSYQIQIFSPTQIGALGGDGLYTTNSAAFCTTTIAQGSSTNEIIVTVVNGPTTVYDYVWSSSDQGWTITSGGLRVERHTWNPTTLIGTSTVMNISSQIVYQEVRFFTNLPSFGNVMTKRIVGPQGPALTTQWLYYTNSSTDGINYGSIKTVIQPSGFWTTYQYDSNGWLTKEVSQFLNAAVNAPDNQSRVVTHDYTPVVANCACELRVEQLLGHEISRQYTLNYGSQIQTVQCQTPGNTDLHAADNVISTTFNATTGPLIGKLATTVNPDGTMQIYSYETNDTQMTSTVATGQPDSSGTYIVDGTRTVTVTGLTGEIISSTTSDIWSAATLAQDTYTYSDDLNRSYTVAHLDLTSETVHYACCGVDLTTVRDGTQTQYLYDSLRRQMASTVNGITTSNVLDPTGNVLATIRIGTDTSRMTLHQATFDTAGQMASETNALGGAIVYAQTFDGSGQTVKTNTYPDGGTRVETYYQDGTLQTVQGTAAYPARYALSVETESGVWRPYSQEIKLTNSGVDTSEWTKTYSDMLGRPYKTLYAAASGSPASQSYYNSQGQLWAQVDPDGVTNLYQYNLKGELEYSAIDINGNATIDFAGTDRITQTVRDVAWPVDQYVRRTQTFVWATDWDGSWTLISEDWVSTDGLHTWHIASGLTNRTDTAYNPSVGQRLVTNTAPDGSYTVAITQYGTNVSFTRYASTGAPITSTTYGYDAYGRPNTVTDSRTGTTTYWFTNVDQVSSTRTPAPATGQSAEVTTNLFDPVGRIWKTTLPDGTSVTNQYFQTGLLQKKSGSRTYPVQYTYDAQGRMTTMQTWQNYAANSGTATTTWNYDSYRGWLASKIYADGHGPAYTYTAAGRLKTRTWARPVTTTYGYNSAGDLTSVSYSDGTPGLAYGLDRRGRQTSITQGSITTSRTLDDAGNLVIESYSGSFLDGLSVANAYDQLLRRTNLSALNASTLLTLSTFSYDAASRLHAVSDGTNSATYAYLANSPLVSQIDFATNGTVVMSTVKQYDNLNRLTSIASLTNSAPVASFAYRYNSADQRTAVTNADNTYWLYTYDALGQVRSGRKYWCDGTPVAGQQFVYAFDDIGNRQNAGSGGNQFGTGLRYQQYSANNLNQYTNRTVPGYENLIGSANSNSTVSLWGSGGLYAPTSRKGEYFWGELPVNNSTGAVWLSITNFAVLTNGTNPDIETNISGSEFLPSTAEIYSYDSDGNLTNDGRWSYTWDAENRLVKMAARVSAGPQISLQFDYDWQGRRIRKRVWGNTGWSGTSTNDQRFVYDAWNLRAELDSGNSPLRTYLWGLDLSGTPQGAGGVGGLLAIGFLGPQATNCYVVFDGNGNVAALLNPAGLDLAAQYHYGPFGELLRATGPMAEANPSRFSTKFRDDETGLIHYGYRFYNSTTGAWPSRDPLYEPGTDADRSTLDTGAVSSVTPDSSLGADPFNLYLFVRNTPISTVDPMGTLIFCNCKPPPMPLPATAPLCGTLFPPPLFKPFGSVIMVGPATGTCALSALGRNLWPTCPCTMVPYLPCTYIRLFVCTAKPGSKTLGSWVGLPPFKLYGACVP